MLIHSHYRSFPLRLAPVRNIKKQPCACSCYILGTCWNIPVFVEPGSLTSRSEKKRSPVRLFKNWMTGKPTGNHCFCQLNQPPKTSTVRFSVLSKSIPLSSPCNLHIYVCQCETTMLSHHISPIQINMFQSSF